jgi:uncharacterized lipoprotein YmbA
MCAFTCILNTQYYLLELYYYLVVCCDTSVGRLLCLHRVEQVDSLIDNQVVTKTEK